MEKDQSTHYNNLISNSKDRVWISTLAIVIGVLLLIMKFYAFHLTNSQAIFSDALESIINVIAGIITLTVIIIAAKPADEDHPYGHGKVESMAASFEGGAITFAGIIIIIESVKAYYQGQVLQQINLGLTLTIAAGIINGAMGLLLRQKGQKLHSEALIASGTHLMTDAFTSIGVLISLLLVKWTQMNWLDPVIASCFGLALCYSGVKILIRSGNVLLDGHDRKLLEKLTDLFEKNHRPGVIHIHHTRIIRSGNFHHIECHVVVPEFWTIAGSHDFSDKFESDMMKDYPVGGALRMHLDPCRRVYCVTCELAECPIRVIAFNKRKPHTFEEVTSPTESL